MNNNLDISFSLINEMLSLSCLIYDCNKELKLKKNKNTFTINTLNIESLKISNVRKNILRQFMILHTNNNYNYDIYRFFDINGVQVAITLNHTDKRINIIFRGSDQFSDWFYNFFLLKKHINNNIRVHSGFNKLLCKNNLYSDIINEINQLKNKYTTYKINIVGHSLGGALATLFAYYLSCYITSNIYIFTFASPRVGNKYWAHTFNNKENLIHYRFVNQKDIITAVPYISYYHCGHYININNNRNINFINKLEYLDNKSIKKINSIKDHCIDRYYTNFNLCFNNNVQI